jgi:hypothetical protein
MGDSALLSPAGRQGEHARGQGGPCDGWNSGPDGYMLRRFKLNSSIQHSNAVRTGFVALFTVGGLTGVALATRNL